MKRRAKDLGTEIGLCAQILKDLGSGELFDPPARRQQVELCRPWRLLAEIGLGAHRGIPEQHAVERAKTAP
jgi:hypothetical protein